MVQGRFLTPDFVNSVQPPAEGEVWIADTKVKGFGLRLFASDKFGKSFAIRVHDETGRLVRRSFSKSLIHRGRPRSFHEEIELGELLEDARSWARQEINELKHLNLAEEEDRKDRAEVAHLVREMTFKRAAENLIKGLRARGRSPAYTTSLFGILKYIPDRLMQKTLAEITPEEMAEALVNNGIDPGNMGKLRSLVVQVFKRADDFGAGLSEFREELSNYIGHRLNADYDPYPDLRRLKRRDYERVLECLERESTRWQQAMCIRLYFEVGAPLSRVMAATWSQIYDGVWYPYLPAGRKYWFVSREPLSDFAAQLIDRINTLVLRDFGEARFLFPSAHRDDDVPIASIEPMWRSALSECGLRYYPLRRFALRFGRRRRTPSYARNTIDYLGLCEGKNVADVSKILSARDDISETYL